MNLQPVLSVPPSAAPSRLLEWLARNGHPVAAPCGGRGVCGKCRVRVVSGTFLDASGVPLLPDANGFVPACQAHCPPEGSEIVIPETVGSGLTDYAVAGKKQAPAWEDARSTPPCPSGASPLLEGGTSISISPPPRGGWHEVPGGVLRASESATGFALDIGTTTLAAALVRLSDGEILSTVSALNPQHVWGADVINRIGACSKGLLEDLQRAVAESVTKLLESAMQKAPGASAPLRMTVAGNPTMLHLFAGVSPEGIGRYPFTPAFLERRILRGAELGLPVPEVVLLPSAGAFLGSDVMGGVLTCGMAELDEPSILMDIGTNGEMVLCAGRRRGGALTGVSAAAGPALEGANISCGTGGVAGAVCKVVRTAPAEFRFRTIGDAPPAGICGCGLVDFIACLLDEETLDESGLLDEEPAELSGVQALADGTVPFPNGTGVALTQRDIREFQLAKSAMRAGLEALLAHGGIALGEVSRLFVAGGLGYYLDGASAVRTGLLPAELLPVMETVGNSSLAGAVRCLTDSAAMEAMDGLAARCGTFDLNSSSVFNDAFVEQMLFPEATE